jgi:hypothetical protein
LGRSKVIAEREIDRIDWSSYRELSGSADGVGQALRDLLAAQSPSHVTEPYWRLENHVFAQDDIYSSAEPAAAVLVAALLDERPPYVRAVIHDLLFVILHGWPADSEPDPEELLARIRARVKEGYWLLVNDAVSRRMGGAMEVLELVDDTKRLDAIRYWIASSDPAESEIATGDD